MEIIVINSPNFGMDAVEKLNKGTDASIKINDFQRGQCPFCIFGEPLFRKSGFTTETWECRNCDRVFARMEE